VYGRTGPRAGNTVLAFQIPPDTTCTKTTVYRRDVITSPVGFFLLILLTATGLAFTSRSGTVIFLNNLLHERRGEDSNLRRQDNLVLRNGRSPGKTVAIATLPPLHHMPLA
jgi:hypothetical protein